jgi:hypothetical protein
MLEFAWRFALLLVVTLGIGPVVGGAILWQVFKLAKIAQFTFIQCWKAYLIGCAYAYLLSIGLRFAWPESTELVVPHVALFVVTTVVAVALYLRDFSRKTLLVVAIAVPLIDALIIGLAMALSQAIPADEPPRRQVPAGTMPTK